MAEPAHDPRPRQDPILRLLGRGQKLPRDQEFDNSAADGTQRPEIGDVVRRGPAAWLKFLGPGLVTGAADDDPSAIGTYAQAGAQAGLGLLWTGVFTLPLMMSVQELAQRIALATRQGLGVNLREKFPVWIVGTAISMLVISNMITLGADLQAVASAVELLTRGALHTGWLIAPAAAVLVGFQVFGKYHLLYKVLRWLALALFAYVVCALIIVPRGGAALYSTLVPRFEWSSGFLLILVAVLGTAVSPYLFIWQPAEEVDNLRAQGRDVASSDVPVREGELRSARVDTFAGMAFSQLVAYSIVFATGAVLHAHGHTQVHSAADAAQALAPLAGPLASIVFAVGLLAAGALSIPVLSGSAAYAVNEVAGIPGSLAGRPQRQPTFYAVIVVSTAVGVAMNLLHLDLISALVIAAALGGVAAAPLLVLMTLLGADRKRMGDRASGRLSRVLTWFTAAAMTAASIAFVASAIMSR